MSEHKVLLTCDDNDKHDTVGDKVCNDDCSTTLKAAKDVEETLWNLRNIFLSIDFDILLWDSLFACFFNYDSKTDINHDNEISQDCSKNWENQQAKESFASSSLNSVRDQNSLLSLATALKFLNIPNDNIPMKYLKMSPASDGMLCLQLDHPHTHDDLLISFTNALWRISIELHTQIVAQRALSVHDQIRILNGAIQNLTELNQLQFQQRMPRFPITLQEEAEDEEEEEEEMVDRNTTFEMAKFVDCSAHKMPGPIRRVHSQALPNSKPFQ
jgi:hypothetical protein